MPAPWTWVWVWMLLAVMSLTLGQPIVKVISAIAENTLTDENNGCTKCHLIYPKKEYRVRSRKRPHNVVFLVEDRQTGRDVKVAFSNGITNDKGVRVLQARFKSKNPCQKFPNRCVYRLISRKTGRPLKIDIQKFLQNRKRTVMLAP